MENQNCRKLIINIRKNRKIRRIVGGIKIHQDVTYDYFTEIYAEKTSKQHLLGRVFTYKFGVNNVTPWMNAWSYFG